MASFISQSAIAMGNTHPTPWSLEAVFTNMSPKSKDINFSQALERDISIACREVQNNHTRGDCVFVSDLNIFFFTLEQVKLQEYAVIVWNKPRGRKMGTGEMLWLMPAAFANNLHGAGTIKVIWPITLVLNDYTNQPLIYCGTYCYSILHCTIVFRQLIKETTQECIHTALFFSLLPKLLMCDYIKLQNVLSMCRKSPGQHWKNNPKWYCLHNKQLRNSPKDKNNLWLNICRGVCVCVRLTSSFPVQEWHQC